MEDVIRIILGLELLEALVVFAKNVSWVFNTRLVVDVLEAERFNTARQLTTTACTYPTAPNQVYFIALFLRTKKLDLFV
jgi:hypothetical protein